MRSFLCLPALAPSVVGVLFVTFSSSVFAQITPDGTLGSEGTIVTPNQTIKDLPADLIEGGASRGANLFHSFLEFNVNDGQRVYFANPSGVATIFSRVTGSNISNIFGTLGVNGGADLFFLNPNGIIFGPNAQLDISGSFVGTTAESIVFGDGIEFSAVDPTAPPLLVVDLPPTGLRFGPNAGDILLVPGEPPELVIVNEEGDAGDLLDTAQAVNPEPAEVPNQIQGNLETDFDVDLYEVFVPAGSTIAPSTVGGSDVDTRLFLFDAQGLGVEAIDDSAGTFQSALSEFTATESGVVYVGVSSFANTPLSAAGEIFAYDFNSFAFTGPGAGASAPLSGWDGAGSASGAYTLTLADVIVLPTADLQVGAGETLALLGGNIRFEGKSIVSPDSQVQLGGLAGVGEVGINSDLSFAFPDSIPRIDVSLSEGAQVNVSGTGRGTINIQASTIQLEDSSLRANIDAGLSSVDANTENLESISLTASGSVSLLNGSEVSASVFGEGDVGAIVIETTDFLAQGESSNGSVSTIFSQVISTGIGNAGGITVNASNTFSLLDGAGLTASTFGEGDAGAIVIETTDFLAQGEDSSGSGSAIFSRVRETGVGNSGGITVSASNTFSLLDGALLDASTFGAGDAGAIAIETTEFLTQGESNNGSVSTIFSQVTGTGVGNSGGITVNASNTFSLLDGARLNASTFGAGNAGAIVIETTDFLAQGESNNGFVSAIFSQVEETGVGNSEGITINASNTFSLLDGAAISASTLGEGNAGAIVIETNDFLAQGENSAGFRSGIFSQVTGTGVGNSGGITVNASNTFSLLDGAGLTASTLGIGNAGAIVIETNDFLAQGEDSAGFRSGIFSQVRGTGVGNSGGITVNASNTFSLLDGAGLTASTFGEGDAGAIAIETTGFLAQGESSAIFSEVNSTGVGNSGGITVNASNTFSLLDGARLNASTRGQGDSGAIVIETTDFLAQGEDSSGNRSGIFSLVTGTGVGNSGGITVNASNTFSLLDGALLDASTFGAGDAGAIVIETTDFLAQGESNNGSVSIIFSEVTGTGVGNSGEITVNASNTFSLLDGAAINASTSGIGDAGDIQVAVANAFTLNRGRIFSSVGNNAQGNGGNIDILSDSLFLTDGSKIDTGTFGEGDAGNITIAVNSNLELHNGSQILGNIGAGAEGRGGDISLTTTTFLADGDSQISTQLASQGRGKIGSIYLHALESVELSEGARLNATIGGQLEGNAGTIEITTKDFLVQGESNSGIPSGIYSAVSDTGTGNAGQILLTATRQINLLNGGQINASMGGQGQAGLIQIQTPDFLAQGESTSFPSGIYSVILAPGIGNSDGILLQAEQVRLQGGARLDVSIAGQGNAGSIQVETQDFFAEGQSSLGGSSGLYSTALRSALGNAGGIVLQATGTVSLQSGAGINVSTFGQGNAGKIEVIADSFLAQGEGTIAGLELPSGISSVVSRTAVGNGGDLSLDAREVTLSAGGRLDSSTFGRGDAGAITVNSSQFLAQGQTSKAFKSGIYSVVDSTAVGNANTISITTPQLTLLDGAVLAADTAGQGNASTIVVNASQGVNIGTNSRLSVETTGPGTPGNITLTTPHLTIANDAQLSATVAATSTNPIGGGNITLNSSQIQIAGQLGIFAETNSLANAGDLVITPTGIAPDLTIEFSDDGFISASTTASGNGGSITLNAPQRIDVAGNGRVAVTTSGSGQAGQINLIAPTIDLRDGVTFSGSTSGSGQGGTIDLQASNALNLDNATIEATTTQGSTGDGGDIFIDPITTTLTNSRIALDSQGTGTGGNLQLISNSLSLDRSEISASTASSDGGSLTLSVPELLTLQNGSIISTQAGTAGAGGNGGNITIDSKLIVGSSNSDIIANAFEGNGGNITINTQGLFGFTVENTDTPRTNLTSDITASSQFGVSSTPNISQAIDPAQSLAVLDTTVADLSNQIDRRCDLVGTPNASRFVITGKGGLPPNDRNRLSLTPLWTALDLTSDSTDPGHNWYKQGNYAEAIDSWETALQSSDLPLEQQVTLHANLAQAYATQGDWDSATEAIDRGLNRLNHHSNPNDGLLNRLRARLLTTQSYLLTERGQLNQAFNLSEEARRLYQEQNDRFGILQTQLNQAQILTRQGNLRQASDRLTTVQNSLEPTENDSLTAAIDLELGTVQRLLGNYTTAQTALERSEALFSQTSAINHATALLALGDNQRDQFVPLNRQFNNIQEQIAIVPPDSRGIIQVRASEIGAIQQTFSNQALTQYRQVQTTAPTPELRLQALTQEFLMTIDLIAARRTPDWSAVTVLQEELQDQSSQLPLSSTRLYARLNLAGGVLELQEKNATVVTPEDLTALLAQTLQDADTLGDRRAKTQALNQLARLYEQQQQWDIAQEFNEAALALAQEDGEADLTYRLLWQLGRLQYAQGQTAEAIVSYTESIEILNTLRSDINTANAEVRFSFRDAVDPIYRELVSLLLSQDTPETSRPENVVQARNLIESLQLSELVNFFQTDCDVTNLAQIDELDPHSAVIYPVILSDRLEVIVSLPGQPLKHYATDLPESTLTQAASIIQQELANPFSQRYLPLAQRLYNAIIRPAEADLNTSEIENLVFVLDGPLRNIPMSVLHDGDQFLIEKYAIALTPGLQLLDPQPLQQQEIEVLLAGLTEARQGFAALPNVQAEIDSIGNTVPSDVLLNDIFVEQNLLTAIESSPSPVVHLATHGEFGSTAEDTFILTWDDRFTANEFSQLLQSRSGGQPIELLILSACRTATGDDRAALGLAGIAVRSGARSTLASLWYISDEATSVLMGKLYESLSQQNVTKAEAVRQAQLELLHNPQYANPYYWAPFVLVGNWL